MWSCPSFLQEELDLSKRDTGDTIDKLVKIEEEDESEKARRPYFVGRAHTCSYHTWCQFTLTYWMEKETEGVVQTVPPNTNKWAVKVDLTEDVENFYEKVPKMAHTVHVYSTFLTSTSLSQDDYFDGAFVAPCF